MKKVSKTRRLKLLKDMGKSLSIHQRGHFTISERVLIETIVECLSEEEEEIPYDPIMSPLSDELTSSIWG